MNFSISLREVEIELNRTFDFVFDEETGEPPDMKLNQAWYEILGMYKMLSATRKGRTDDEDARDRIREMLCRAMVTVETLYDEQVTGRRDGACRFAGLHAAR